MDTLLCLLKRFRKLLDLASRKKFVSKEVRKAKEGGVKISAKNAAEAAATLSHVPTFSYEEVLSLLLLRFALSLCFSLQQHESSSGKN